MMSAHIDALQRKKTNLEKRIQEELKHPFHDDLEVRRMKSDKLHIEEEIQGIR